MKYSTGLYMMIKFTRVGSKMKTKSFKSYGEARDKMIKFLKKNPDCSVVITRVIFNSKGLNNKWDYVIPVMIRNKLQAPGDE